jgi:competence ComEA-like helix-hairpin-helix protein
MIKNIWKDYFTFSKKERNAVCIVLFILAIVIMLPLFFPAKKLSITIDEKLQQQLDSLQQKRSISNVSYIDTIPSSDSGNLKTSPVTLFPFDPNTLDEQGFKQLGLSDKVVRTIINYRNKGGYFKTPQDIKKIYGLSTADAERLIPYIKITSTNKNNNYKNNVGQATGKSASSNTNYYHTIHINTATAEEWKTLPGIGDILANRIVKFRNSMGGFKSVDDVKKTYGLSDSTFNLIRPYLVLK